MEELAKAVKKVGYRFKPGQSGNPKGRPEGSRNRATIACQTLLDGQAQALTQKIIELALAGDQGALRLCIERLIPKRRDLPVTVDLPKIENLVDAERVLAKITSSMTTGELTPYEAKALADVIEVYRKAIETVELQQRLNELERRADEN